VDLLQRAPVNRAEQIFLISKVVVESAARDSCSSQNIVYRGFRESSSREQAAGDPDDELASCTRLMSPEAKFFSLHVFDQLTDR
jgi:hypothetical protein